MIRKLLFLGLAWTLCSCSSTRESGLVREAGFLRHPERIGTRTERSWSVPDFDPNDFVAVWVPPVSLLLDDESGASLTQKDIDRLAILFHQRVSARMEEEGWSVVEEPGENVLALHLALSELGPADPVGNVVSATVPYLNTAVKVVAITADVHVFVGSASIELLLEDAATGEVLGEGLDRRVGNQSLVNIGSTWGDVEDAMGVWADGIAEGLTKMGEKSN